MLTLSAGYLQHLAKPTTQLATLWKITRRDSNVFRFTDHDADLVVPADGTYVAAGYNASAHAANAGLSVDNGEVGAVFDSAAITEADLLAGEWDGAAVQISECVWSDLALGTRAIRNGVLGRVSYDGTAFRAELLGIAHKLATNIGRLITPQCDALLGDTRCGKSLTSFTHSATVTAAASRLSFTDSALAQAADYFEFGLCTWLTGANAGAAHEIKRHQTGGVITLFLPTVADIAVGDTATLVAGCAKTAAACLSKFSNLDNFRGYPHVPGNDAVLRTNTA